MATLVHAPSTLVVATSDGIAIRFAGVQIGVPDWQGKVGVALTLEAVRGEETHRRDRQLADDREAWSAEIARGGGVSPAMLLSCPVSRS